MACSCDSCSSPRIIKTRTAQFWRWLAESRGETADRVILAPGRTADLFERNDLNDRGMAVESAETRSDAWEGEVDLRRLDRCRAEFLELLG
jgi:hypothetical protein